MFVKRNESQRIATMYICVFVTQKVVFKKHVRMYENMRYLKLN